MASHALDVEKFERLAARTRLKNRQEIAAASGVQLRTLSKAFSGGHLAVDTLMKLSNAVGLGSDYEELILWPSEKSSSDGEEVTPTVLEGTSSMEEQQDIKLLLTSLEMSQSLLDARTLISFAECLKATRVWTPIDDSHKDHPIVPTLAYNHFVQPSIVLTLDINEPASVIGYSRVRRPLQPSNAHTAGMSILIAGSPIWNVTRHKKSALDHWLATTHSPKRATSQLLGGLAPAILHFVNYKIDLLRYECRILPLGVILLEVREKREIQGYGLVILAVLHPAIELAQELIRRPSIAHAEIVEVRRLSDLRWDYDPLRKASGRQVAVVCDMVASGRTARQAFEAIRFLGLEPIGLFSVLSVGERDLLGVNEYSCCRCSSEDLEREALSRAT